MSTATAQFESASSDAEVLRLQHPVEPKPVAAAPVTSAKGPPKALLAAVAIAAIGAATWYAQARKFEDTDDAQVDGDIGAISPRVSGTLRKVNVTENDQVKAGDVLAEIDPADYDVLVAQSEAAVAQAQALVQAEDPSVPIATTSNEAGIRSASLELNAAGSALAQARKEQSQLTATLAQAQANARLARIELGRSTSLRADDAIAQSELDIRQNASTSADALVQAQTDALAGAKDRIDQAQSRMDSARTRLNETTVNAPRTMETRRANVLAREAALKMAQEQLAQAKLNLSYTQIVAPANGIIGKKAVTIGDRVAPGQELMALSQTDSLWITANFRETQLRRIRPHQPVQLYVDAIDTELHGEVESIGGATGSRYSVLPPENASGNYVKVVQRIPIRIRLDPGQPGLDRLRPGMSVEPKVRVIP